MDKLLFFRYSATDSFAAPASNLIKMVGSGLGQVTLYFDSFSRKGNPQAIQLNCPDEKKAIEDINNSIKNSREPIVVVADNVSSSYISSGITSQTTATSSLYSNPA
jgi:hypothetical protein